MKIPTEFPKGGGAAASIRRHIDAWKHSWRERHQGTHDALTADEAAFLPAALAATERPASPSAKLVARGLMLFIFATLAWTVFGRMDIVVSAQGKVIPSARVKTIAAVDTASVLRVDVMEGQSVRAGQPLVYLDDSALIAQLARARDEASEAVLERARQDALVEAIDSDQPPELATAAALHASDGVVIDPDDYDLAVRHVGAQFDDYLARSKQLDGEIEHLSKQVPLMARLIASMEKLNRTQDVPLNELLAKKQTMLQLQAQLRRAMDQKSSLRADMRRQALDGSAASRHTALSARHDAERFSALVKHYTLTSPIDGTVQQLTLHTVGGVAAAAQPIMQIVPQDNLIEVEAFVLGKDRGFVHVGQPAAVKFDAFNYTKYGTVAGRVTQISPDAVEDEAHGLVYAVRVALARATMDVDGHRTAVTAGMSVNVEIKTGERRIIEYVLSPLVRHVHEAFSER